MMQTDPAERRALLVLRVAGTAVLLLAAMMNAVFPRAPLHENVSGFSNPVLGFELAAQPSHVFGILGAPGDPGRDDAVRRMDRGNRIDFLFMIAYPAFFVAIGLLLGAHGSLSGSGRTALIALAVVMAIGDALENRELLWLSGATDAAAMGPSLVRLQIFTRLKWYAIFAASGLITVAVWRERGWWRWSALLFALAAACGVVSLVHAPAIEMGMLALALAWILTYVRALRPPVAR